MSSDVFLNGKGERNLTARLRAIYDNSSIAIYETDEKGSCIWVNDLWCRFAGLTPEEALGDGWQRGLHPDDREHVFNLWKLHARTGKPWNTEYRFRTHEGIVTWVMGTASPVTDDKSVITGYIGINIDISDRMKIRQELDENYILLGIAGRTAMFGGWSVRLRDMKLKWSDEVARIHEVEPGFSPDVEKGINFYAPEWHERIKRVFNDCMVHGIPYDEAMQIITAKGNRRWVRTIGEPVRNRAGKIIKVQGSFQDIDTIKKAEEELNQTNRRLAALNDTREKLFSIIAHDLRSPFNSIMGLSEVLSERLRESEQKDALKLAESINRSSTCTYYLLENLLAWAAGQTGNLKYNPEPVKVSALLSLIAETAYPASSAKNVTIVTECDERLTAMADINMLRTIARNLVSNAIKYSTNGDAVTLMAIQGEAMIEVSITDTGTGMSRETVEKLFSYEGVKSVPGTANEKGSGLGLRICKEFTEMHGGTIRAESSPGKGTKITFTIPAA